MRDGIRAWNNAIGANITENASSNNTTLLAITIHSGLGGMTAGGGTIGLLILKSP